jgi:hypothetical protein
MLISLSGLAGSGKDTIADYLIKEHGFIKKSWAGNLKDMCAVLFSWDREMLEGRTPEARKQREIVDTWWSRKLGIPNFTPRYALQHLGTETLREHFHQNIWVFSLSKYLADNTDKNIVITDTRFPNEISELSNFNAQTWFIERNVPDWWQALNDSDLSKYRDIHDFMTAFYPKIHSSEYMMYELNCDTKIKNNSTIEALYQIVEQLV